MKKYFALMSMAFVLTGTAFAMEAQNEQLFSAEDLSAELSLPADSISDQAVSSFDRGDRFPHRQVVCYARNRRGIRFEAEGRFPDRVQARAMEKCYRHPSRRCFEEGCRAY